MTLSVVSLRIAFVGIQRPGVKVPYFEFIGEDKERGVEHSTKYWEISQVGKKLTIRYGKIGTDGQLIVKEFESKEDADVELSKLIKSKTKKGYVKKPNPHS